MFEIYFSESSHRSDAESFAQIPNDKASVSEFQIEVETYLRTILGRTTAKNIYMTLELLSHSLQRSTFRAKNLANEVETWVPEVRNQNLKRIRDALNR